MKEYQSSEIPLNGLTIEMVRESVKYLPQEWNIVDGIEYSISADGFIKNPIYFVLRFNDGNNKLRLKCIFKQQYIYLSAIHCGYSLIDLFYWLAKIYSAKIIYTKMAQSHKMKFDGNVIKILRSSDWIFADISKSKKQKIVKQYSTDRSELDWRTKYYGEWYYIVRNNLLPKDFYEDYICEFLKNYKIDQKFNVERYCCTTSGIELSLNQNSQSFIDFKIRFDENNTIIQLAKEMSITQKKVWDIMRDIIPDGKTDKNDHYLFLLPIERDVVLDKVRRAYKLYAIDVPDD